MKKMQNRASAGTPEGMGEFRRVILIVLDSFGVGALPDAEAYGDAGANTLGHIADTVPTFRLPNLAELGLFAIDGVHRDPGLSDRKSSGGESGEIQEKQKGLVAKLAEKSKGKDTITGHWEIAGILTETPFRTYPDGFPKELMKRFEQEIGTETLGNYPASGTEIIEVLGPEHEATGKPIVYTSADSVFQIAADVDIIPLEKLYEICAAARRLLVGEFACGRVIARPYRKDENGKRLRTSDRRDYAVSPPQDTMLNKISDAGKTVFAVGKIHDIFNGCGVTRSVHTEDNEDGINKTLEALCEDFEGLIFTNLVDFDSKYGHRRDPEGYAKALEAFDRRLPELKAALREDDVLMLCADHGNDPTHSGWDHTREYIPFLAYSKRMEQGRAGAGRNLGIRSTFADIGATICDLLGVPGTVIGESFGGEFNEHD